MNRRELNEKLERFADWCLDSLRSRDHTVYYLIFIGIVLIIAVRSCGKA